MCDLCDSARVRQSKQADLRRDAGAMRDLARRLEQFAQGTIPPHSDESGALAQQLFRLGVKLIKEWD